MLTDDATQTFANALCLRQSLIKQRDTKLFTANAKQIFIPNHLRQQLRGFNQHFIAGIVAKLIVDLFEVIQIDNQQTQRRIVVFMLFKMVEGGREGQTIVSARQ